jgi:RNA polymerase sigma-70 factor (ECF subfamily)
MQQACSTQMPDLSKGAEIELVASAQRNPTAFRGLYEQYARPVYRYLYSKVGNQIDAEDLTSQVFLKALEELGKFRNQGGFRAWLFSIAYSQAMDYYRKRRAELPLDAINLASHEPDPLAATLHQEQIRRMREKIATLPEEEQELIRLRFIAGLRYAEIGAVLKRSEAAVKKDLYRLLARLAEQMEDDRG